MLELLKSRAQLYAKLLMATCAVGLLAGFLEPWGWGFDLFNHFVFLYLCAFVVAGLALAVTRQRKSLLLAVCLAVAAALRVYGDSISTAAPAGAQRLQVTHFNVHTVNHRRQTILDRVVESDADLAVLLEVGPEWGAILDQMEPPWRVVQFHPQRDNFGIALLARRPVESTRLLSMGPFSLATVEARLELDGLPVTLLGVHAAPPVDDRYVDARDRHFLELARRVKTSTEAMILVGDFNATPWSRPLQRLLQDTGLRSAHRAHDATWPADFPIGIPIDLTLHAPSLTVTRRVLGDPLGSDHRPVHVSFARAAHGGPSGSKR